MGEVGLEQLNGGGISGYYAAQRRHDPLINRAFAIDERRDPVHTNDLAAACLYGFCDLNG